MATESYIIRGAHLALTRYGTPKYFNVNGECDLQCPAGHTFTVYRAPNWSSDRRITLPLVREALRKHAEDQEIDGDPCFR